MRAVVVAIVLFVGCSFDWDSYDPQGGPAGSGAADGGAAGALDGGGGVGGALCGSGLQPCDTRCVDIDSDPDHCGDCMTSCVPTELCLAGSCRSAPSCKALHDGRPTLSDGIYTLDPGRGLQVYSAFCDMTIDGGGWTLVASVVDNSYFTGTRCSTICDPNPASGSCDEAPFADALVVGDVADMLTADHKSAAYSAVAFDEMLFVDSNGHYVSYGVAGPNVRDWYPVGLANWVADGTEAHATHSYPANATDLDPSLNPCNTLRVSFNVEDSDSPVGGSCHDSSRGPAWSRMNNNGCFWDEGGVPWTEGAFYQGNATDHRLWLVR